MPVTTETRGRVLLVRLDRDAKRNAMDHAMTLGLDAAMNRLERADEQYRALDAYLGELAQQHPVWPSPTPTSQPVDAAANHARYDLDHAA